MNHLRSDGERVWESWAAMWNGDLARADALFRDRPLAVHLTDVGVQLATPGQLRGGSAREVRAWVERVRGRYAQLRYTTCAGPFVDVDRGVLVATWEAHGTTLAGESVRVVGTDVLGFSEGTVREYWAINSPGGWHH